MKNRLPNVFVSSTMYDLSHLRGRLSGFIEGLGWNAVMAERGSFAIDANETTVENSLRNVRENSDIFVMVVGARYGSVDPGADESVTSLEFRVAQACGVPAYVFVDSSVLPLLRMWRSNPDADYSDVVDTPRVFEFIDSFHGGGAVWTFPFSTAEDIVDTLRTQFAYLVQDALDVRRMASDSDLLLEALEGDALMLALRRDDYWEHRLFGTVLEQELNRRAPIRRKVEHRLERGEATYVSLADFCEWGLNRMSEFKRYGRSAETILNDYLQQALGDAGEEGEPLEIAGAARQLAQLWEDAVRWTLICRSVRVDPEAERAVELLANATANMLDEIWEFGHSVIPRLEEAITEHAEANSEVVVTMTLTLTADFGDFSEEMTRIEMELRRRLG